MNSDENDLAQNIREALARYKRSGVPGPDGAKFVVVTFDVPDMDFQAEFTLPDQEFYQPPVVFEKSHGLTGISHQYTLPQGLTATDIESYITLIEHDHALSDKQRNDKTAAVWRTLKELNPVLQGMHDEKKNPQLTHFYIFGATGSFNPADIRYFAAKYRSTGNPCQAMKDGADYKKLNVIFNTVAPRLIDDINWAAAPKTLRCIEKQIQVKFKLPYPAAPACPRS